MTIKEVFKVNNEKQVETERKMVNADNGSSFTEKNKITFTLDPSLDFVSLENVYLHFDIELSTNDAVYNFGKQGVSKCIRSIRVLDRYGNFLENVENYNVLSSVMMDYCNTSGQTNAKSLTELCYERPNNKAVNYIVNQIFRTPYTRASTDETAQQVRVKQKCVVKLYSSFFNNSKTIYPNMLNPIRIEVVLEDNKSALEVIAQGNLSSVSECAVNFSTLTGASPETYIEIKNDDVRGINVANYNNYGSPFGVGDNLSVKKADGSAQEVLGEIERVQVVGGRYRYTIQGGFTTTATFDNTAIIGFTPSTLSGKYQITNPRLEVAVVNGLDKSYTDNLLKLVAQGQFRYGFKSWNCVSFSQTKNSTDMIVNINSNDSACVGVLTIPQDSETQASYNNNTITGYYNSTGLYSAQYYYNGNPQPSLPVRLDKINNDCCNQEHFHELVSALEDMNYDVYSLTQFKTNFCLGRSLSGVKDAVCRLTNKDLSLRVQTLSGTTTQKNINFHNYLLVHRTIIIDNDGIRVEY